MLRILKLYLRFENIRSNTMKFPMGGNKRDIPDELC